MSADASSAELLWGWGWGGVKPNKSSTLNRQRANVKIKGANTAMTGKREFGGGKKEKAWLWIVSPLLQTFMWASKIPFSCATEWRLPVWSGRREILVGDSVAPASPKPQ